MKTNRLTLSVNFVLKPLSVAGMLYMLHSLHHVLLHPSNLTLILAADVVFLLLSIIWSYVIMDKLEAHGAWGWVLLLGGLMGSTYAITAYAQYENSHVEALATNSIYMEAKKNDKLTFYSQSKKNELKSQLDQAKSNLSSMTSKIEAKTIAFKNSYSEAKAEAMLVALKADDKKSYLSKVRDVSNKGYQLTSPLYLARAIYQEELKLLKKNEQEAKNQSSYIDVLNLVTNAQKAYNAYTKEAIMAKKMEYKKIMLKQEELIASSSLLSLDMLLKIWLSIGLVLEIFGSPLAMWLTLATQNNKKVLQNSAIVDEENRINGIISSFCSRKTITTLAKEHEILKPNGEVQSFYAALFNYIVFAIDKDIGFNEVPVISKNNREDANFLHGWSLQNPATQTQKTVKLRDGSVYTPLKSSPSKFTVEIKAMLENYEHKKISMEDVKNIILEKKAQKVA